MKRDLDEILSTEILSEENNTKKQKTYKPGDIILLDDELNVSYEIESERNIFIRHFAKIKCPLCNDKIYQYISMGYDEDPEEINFESINLQNHMRETHKDIFLCMKKTLTDTNKKICKLIFTKKVIL